MGLIVSGLGNPVMATLRQISLIKNPASVTLLCAMCVYGFPYLHWKVLYLKGQVSVWTGSSGDLLSVREFHH